MQFTATRVQVVEDGHVLHHGGRRWRVRDDFPIGIDDVIYTTEEGYQDTLIALSHMNLVGSRYLQ